MSVFSGDGELDPASFGSIHSICGNKPVLIVLDYDGSGFFAESAAAKTDGEVFYLAAGNFLPSNTAVVLCYADGKIPDAPGYGNVRYAIYSTMFHRSFFQLVVFTSENPKLTEIAPLLNGPESGCQGFMSESISCGCGCEEMRLRDFFGGPVDPNALLGILAPRPSGGFIDDLDHFVDEAPECEGRFDLLNEFVRVEFDADGQVRVAAHGQFRSDHPVHSVIQRHIRLDPSLPPISTRFSDRMVVGRAINLLLTKREMDEGGEDSSTERPEPESVGTWPADSRAEPPDLDPMTNLPADSGPERPVPEAITASPDDSGAERPAPEAITTSSADSRAERPRLDPMTECAVDLCEGNPNVITISPADSSAERPAPEAITASPDDSRAEPLELDPMADWPVNLYEGNPKVITIFPGGSCERFVPLTRQEFRKLRGIHRFLLRENGATGKSATELHPWIREHLDLSDLSGWCGALRAAQEVLCKEFPQGGRRRAAEAWW
jgi:hypothetical protein